MNMEDLINRVDDLETKVARQSVFIAVLKRITGWDLPEHNELVLTRIVTDVTPTFDMVYPAEDVTPEEAELLVEINPADGAGNE